MIRKIVKMVWVGISCGCTISCLISMVGAELMGYEWFATAARGYTEQVVAAMIVGVAWSLPSLVYDNEKLSRAQQVLIHAGIGFGVFLPIAFYMQWIPMSSAAMVLAGVAVMIISAMLIWCGFYLYYRGESKEINRQLMSMEEARENK